MSDSIIKEDIVGSRNINSIAGMVILLVAGMGFFLAGLSSYFNINLLKITDTSTITFIPQGIVMLFYGTGAIGIAIYLLLTIFWNIGSGYNEFSKKDNTIRIVRLGFQEKIEPYFYHTILKILKILNF